MLAPGRRVGVLTFDASALTERELTGAGITSEMPVAIAGMEAEAEFHRVILEDRPTLDVESARREHVRVATRLCAAHPDVGAIVLECTNMPPYAPDIRHATGLAVFDLIHLITLVHQALTHSIPGKDLTVRLIRPRRIRP
jgi:Asp/Glu/hydantoin racemase